MCWAEQANVGKQQWKAKYYMSGESLGDGQVTDTSSLTDVTFVNEPLILPLMSR